MVSDEKECRKLKSPITSAKCDIRQNSVERKSREEAAI
jgi:hypothetical protein